MTKSVVTLVALILVICLMGYIALYGLNIGEWRIPNVFDEQAGVRKGMDLVGGTVITFEAQTDLPAGSQELSTGMDAAVTMMTTRLSTMGYFEATVAKTGDRRLRIEIPAIQDPEEASQKLGPTAQLEFLDADGTVLMTGQEVKSATAMYGPVDNTGTSSHYVSLVLSDPQKFTEVTKQIALRAADGTNYLAIALDGEIKSAPFVDAKYSTTGINADDVVISGQFTAESARELANYINIGQLPFTLKEVELRAVGPQLGDRALENSLMGAGIGILLVFVFMIITYRLPGAAASIALSFYVVLVAIVLTIFRINLSLAGIAGIILSIGMAVDANCIIFERIKEELNNGKTVRASIAAGFSNAFSSIIDSNVTTLIAAGVLWYRGSGSVQGFAITLFIGVVVSMFTAIFITRLLLNIANSLKLNKPSFFGAKG